MAADKAGVGDRTTFEVAAAKGYPGAGYDLVTFFDCLHDMGDPVGAARHVRKSLAPGGVWMLVEPFANDRLEDNLNPVATMFYGFSVFHCMTQSLARGGPGLGTCMGPKQTEKLVRAAGFREFKMLDIKSQTNLFYCATP